MRHVSLLLGLCLLLAVAPASVSAQKLFGDYVIHHGTMLTSNLTPQVAREYGITRSDHRGLVTVAVRKTGNGGEEKPVRAKVWAVAVNLSSQRRDLEMREVDEGEAIYYLSDFRINPPEKVRLEVHVQPEGSDEEHVFEVSRLFAAD
ncbi:hypothetical protein AN478_02485 [Thiohalorhabdus denitrificans]|uniref:DUF4426 domain-containing protein n=1 Tax=Thiohalorhabdus denitrificans TaxID=381306 RepID=A0A0P9CX89_9GAMM|nr:DUF4426 domain-containing protein [Thiohalorhabdus denitrificans]KPV41456.1 hypothetical protein AN478_02485 [Thiohalorhabdus denitrificans]SCY28197.1 protein of unknown function [Thiohalorhabdus denitrificans]